MITMASIISAQQAAELLHSGMTVGVGGFGAYSCPDELLRAVAIRFAESGQPSGLTVVTGITPGPNQDSDLGLAQWKAPGLIGTIIAGHIGNAPEIARLVGRNEIAGYVLPLGVVMHLFRAIAGKKPGVLTHVGLGTYADPRNEGCIGNEKARAQGRKIVSLFQLEEGEALLYHAFPIDACLIRATYADEDGNLSLAHEALVDAQLEMAAAVHNNGGIVIAQVEEVVQRGTLPPKTVRLHRSLVDYVVKATIRDLHWQSYACRDYRPELTGEIRCPTSAAAPMPLTIRKVIARRGALELRPNALINLGIGIPSGVASVANEEGIAGYTTLSLESGPTGGVPLEGLGFAASVNPEAIYNIADTFDLYDGGVLDMTFLGAAEIDADGNVNVSRFGDRCTGPGGFINISQNTPKVCFMGAFTSGKLSTDISDGRLEITAEGTGKKFVKKVQQITFSADYARKTGQEVLYITERAVFRLGDQGLLLTEIAPGIDLQKDILDQMDFLPHIAPDLKEMDRRIFSDEKMGLAL